MKKKKTWRLILAFALRKRNDLIVDALKPASSCQKVNDNAITELLDFSDLY